MNKFLELIILSFLGVIGLIILIIALLKVDQTFKEKDRLEQELNITKEIADIATAKLLTQQIHIADVYAHMTNKELSLADHTYRAAKEYGIDPLLLTLLIDSESEYDVNVSHKANSVIGLGGINLKYWKLPNDTLEEQIYAAAMVYAHYFDKYQDPIKALTAYKGISELGRKRAKLVWNKFLEVKGVSNGD